MSIVPHHPRKRARFSEPLITDPALRFAGIDTDELDLFIERRKLDRAIILLNGSDLSPIQRSTLAVVEADLADAIGEMERRVKAARRLHGDPLAPRLPRGNSALIELAAQLKAEWPIDRFCEVLLGLNLDRKGRNPKARCPLGIHRDTNPSFTLYVDDGRYHCFGCGEHGDLWDLTQIIQRVGFAEAVDMVAEATIGRASDGGER